MDLHPIDARRHHPTGKRPLIANHTIKTCQLHGTPPLAVLLAGDPDLSISATSVDLKEAVSLKAVDVIAHHVANNIRDRRYTEGISEWLESAPTAAVERFVIGIAIHAPPFSPIAPRHQRMKKDLEAILTHPRGLGGLPTADRVLPGSDSLAWPLLTPERTKRIRSMDWRDAAGRRIDAFLIDGPFSAASLPPPPSDHIVDRAVAHLIDSRPNPSASNLDALLRVTGVVLSNAHRQALIDLQEDVTQRPSSADRKSIYELTNMDISIQRWASQPSAEVIRSLLQIDRANRSMSQCIQPAAEQEQPHPEQSVAFTL